MIAGKKVRCEIRNWNITGNMSQTTFTPTPTFVHKILIEVPLSLSNILFT